jgi:hypothetical protein
LITADKIHRAPFIAQFAMGGNVNFSPSFASVIPFTVPATNVTFVPLKFLHNQAEGLAFRRGKGTPFFVHYNPTRIRSVFLYTSKASVTFGNMNHTPCQATRGVGSS